MGFPNIFIRISLLALHCKISMFPQSKVQAKGSYLKANTAKGLSNALLGLQFFIFYVHKLVILMVPFELISFFVTINAMSGHRIKPTLLRSELKLKL